MGDLIERQSLLDALSTWDKFGCDADTKLVPYKDDYIPYIRYDDVVKCINGLPFVSTEKTDDYKQGWHDAIEKALKEAYNIYHYGDIFRVVQEETLIGVGMAYEQVNAEKTGHWIDKDDKSAVCSCCNRNNTLYGDFCKWCGAKMEVEE